MINPQKLLEAAAAQRRTKIVATLGPTSWDEPMITRLIEAGVNVFRLNFSHGTYAQHLQTLTRIRSCAATAGATVAVLQDLSGPKIRISTVQEGAELITDEQVVLLMAADGGDSTNECIRVEALNPADYLKPSDSVLLADGIIELQVVAVENDLVSCRARRGGRLRSRVGIAFPDSEITLPATTAKDLVDLEWGLAQQVDYVAISFVQQAEDINRIKAIIARQHSPIRVIAKIEHKASLRNIDEILAASDGIMIARGDLGVEVPIQTLPLIQAELTKRAAELGRPVIVATQMLHSMVTAVRPTRAEVTDVAVAVRESADAVMLSEETAIGQHPALAVSYLDRIARVMEAHCDYNEHQVRLGRLAGHSAADAAAFSACGAADKVQAAAIIACTRSGHSPQLVAKYRPEQQLFAASADQKVLNQQALIWGVRPLRIPATEERAAEAAQAAAALLQQAPELKGQPALVLSGRLCGEAGSSTVLEIIQL